MSSKRAYEASASADIMAHSRARYSNDDYDDHDDSSSDSDEQLFGDVMASSVPHMFSEASTANAVSAMQSFVPSGTEAFSGVREVTSLRESRRRTGFYPDDGRSEAYGGERNPGALFDDAWLEDRIAAIRALEADAYYRFAEHAAAGVNLPLSDFIDDSAAKRETQRRVAAVIAQVRRAADERASQIASPASIERMREELRRLEGVVGAKLSQRQSAETAMQCIKTGLADASALFRDTEKVYDDNPTAPLADVFAVWAVATQGARGYRKTLAMAQRALNLRASANLPNMNTANSKKLLEAMPSSASLAFSLACLAIVANDPELLAIIANASADDLSLFEATSEYAQDASLYARDLITLADLLFTEIPDKPGKSTTDNLLLFGQITHTLFAHLNRTNRRAALDPDDFPLLRRPKRAGATPRKRTRTVGNVTIDLDIDINDLEAIADGVPVDALDPNKLRALQSELGENQSSVTTPQLVERLLEPMVTLVYPELFFRVPADAPLDDRHDPTAFAGVEFGRVTRRQTTAFSTNMTCIEALFGGARKILEYSGAAPGSVKTVLAAMKFSMASGDAMTSDAKADLKTIMGINARINSAYKSVIRKRILHQSGLALCIAQLFLVASEIGVRLLNSSDEEIATLASYADARRAGDFAAAELEDRVTRIILFGHPTAVKGVDFTEPSSLAAFAAFDGTSASSTAALQLLDARLELTRANDRVSNARQVLRTAEKKLVDSAAGEAAALEQSLVDALRESYIPTHQEALAPRNTGVVFFSGIMRTAVTKAFDLIRQYIPCMYRSFDSASKLVESEEYWSLFADLAAAMVRLVSAQNPITYQPDKSEARGKLQVRSALDALRSRFMHNTGVYHGAGCPCQSGTAAGIYPALANIDSARAGVVRRLAGIGKGGAW